MFIDRLESAFKDGHHSLPRTPDGFPLIFTGVESDKWGLQKKKAADHCFGLNANQLSIKHDGVVHCQVQLYRQAL